MILGDATRISSQWHDHLLARFDRFLVTGGLPAVVRAYATGEDHALVWRQIVADYEQDFIAIELARGGQPLAGWKRSSAGSAHGRRRRSRLPWRQVGQETAQPTSVDELREQRRRAVARALIRTRPICWRVAGGVICPNEAG